MTVGSQVLCDVVLYCVQGTGRYVVLYCVLGTGRYVVLHCVLGTGWDVHTEMVQYEVIKALELRAS